MTFCWNYSNRILLRHIYMKMENLQKESSVISVDLGDMRTSYKGKSEAFTEENLKYKEPVAQFKEWFEEAAQSHSFIEANAMHLATATKDGIPSVRVVLLKSFGTDGFKFYTNYLSRKGKELEENPRAALSFFWGLLHRCVRIEGTVEKLSEEESTKYFHQRPFENQIGSSISKQSTPIPNRQFLTSQEDELIEKYESGKKVVPKPSWWGGYVVKPHSFEFWQGQTTRIHDRIRFRKCEPGEEPDGVLLHQGDNGWVYERLSP